MSPAHLAAESGDASLLSALLAGDPTLVHSRDGMDACTPLHFAANAEIARILVDAGADIEAQDEDHDSPPVRWLIKKAPDAVRFLLDRGAKADIFLAAGLGDLALAQRLIDADPACPSYRIGRSPQAPALGQGRGGTIYQWTLGFNCYAHQIAARRGHADVAQLLWDRSDERTRFLVACVTANRAEAELRKHLVGSLDDQDLQLLPRYCWETNPSLAAVELMLDCGFPIDHTEHSHGYSSLHNAAWSGEPEIVELLIARGAPINLRDPGYHSTPLGWALHCCLVEMRHPEADYPRIARALLAAGAEIDNVNFPTGNVALDDVLRRYCS